MTACALAQCAVLLNPEMVLLDCEELYNATHGLELLRGHFSSLFALQYRAHCGGCTLDALLAALSFLLLGPGLLAWKLVPTFFLLVGVAAGVHRLQAHEGTGAALLFGLLALLPPYAWMHLSLLAWGNHFECSVMGFCAYLLVLDAPPPTAPRRTRLAWASGLGLLCGVGVWTGFSMVYALMAVGAFLALGRRWALVPPLAVGMAAGLTPWLLKWITTGESPFGTIYNQGEATPSLVRLPGQVWRLLAPNQLAALFGLPTPELGTALGLGWALSLGAAILLALRKGPSSARWALAFLAAWLGLYALSDFQLHAPAWPGIATPMGVRYAAPLWLLGFALVAIVAHRAWRSHRRWLALALLAPPVASGLAARAAVLTPPFPDPITLRRLGVDYEYFRLQGAYSLTPQAHLACTDTQPSSQAWHAFATGRAEAWNAVDQDRPLDTLSPPLHLPRDPWLEGVGCGVVDWVDPGFTGQLPLMARVERSLAVLAPTDERTALTEALWQRMYAHDEWALPLQGRTSQALAELDQMLRSQPDLLRTAWLEAYGRRWARSEATWSQPATLPFPRGRPRDLVEFARGYGAGLGEQWGPRDRIPRPAGLPEALEAPLLEGYLQVLPDHWTGPFSAPLLEVTSSGPASDPPRRWWRSSGPQRGACH